jgi:hypothetical protein
MITHFSIEALILLTSSVFSVALITLFLIKGERTPVFYSHLCCQILIFIWLTGQLTDVIIVYEPLKWWNRVYMFFAICFIGVSWLIFSLLFTGHRLVKNKTFLIVIFAIPAFFYLSLVTNQYHFLFFLNNGLQPIQGPLFWGHVLES